MFKKHAPLIGIAISLLLLVIATFYYPGGSQADKNSVGYDWGNNYLSNLFGAKAINGMPNGARFWAASGMLFFSIGFTLFFWEFSKKIPTKVAAGIVKYCGSSAMLCAFLAVTPLHDIMVTIAGTLALVSIFYITVFTFRSKLLVLKILCVVCLAILYTCNFIYYTQNYIVYLPILQKTAYVIVCTWALSLHYFTSNTNFQVSQK
jgi:hypothetical protein